MATKRIFTKEELLASPFFLTEKQADAIVSHNAEVKAVAPKVQPIPKVAPKASPKAKPVVKPKVQPKKPK